LLPKDREKAIIEVSHNFPDYNHFTQKYFANRQSGLNLPAPICNAICKCLKSDFKEIDDAIKALGSIYKNDYYKPPSPIDYSKIDIIDAYTAKYLPRNYHIPFIAFRCLAFNPKCTQFGQAIKVLDIGSGTGALALVVFDLFDWDLLKYYCIEYTAIDKYIGAIERQKELIKTMNVDLDRHRWNSMIIDLKTSQLSPSFPAGERWDIIFIANTLIEFEPSERGKIISDSFHLLNDNGSLIIVDLQYNHIQSLMVKINKTLNKYNVPIYYPCKNNTSCQLSDCWMWLKYGINSPNIVHQGTSLPSFDGPMQIFMLIINKGGHTIYDDICKKYPQFNISVARNNLKDKKNKYVEACCMGNINSTQQLKPGSIYGFELIQGGLTIHELAEI
jgi:SAM-dependent methyltransferase